MRTLALVVLCLSSLPDRSAAQGPVYEESLRASVALGVVTPAPGIPVLAAPRAAPAAARRAPGTVWMIVGGAILVVGIVADEDLLVIGGAVVAGYGLYLNVR